MGGKPLNIRQQRFVDEYCVDQNATRAAERAGYAVRTAKQQGSRLLSYAYVSAAIAAKMERLSRKVEITAEGILSDLKDVQAAAMAAENHNAANKSLELQGKFLGIWLEKHQVDVGPTLAELIDNAASYDDE